MSARMFFRFALPALAALPLGFLGLALAAQNEPSIPAPLLVLLSPGLKLAELITPEHHASLGATFGWFLRIGIGVNAIYYFLVFAMLAYLATRHRPTASRQ
jgi:hypothetical protein